MHFGIAEDELGFWIPAGRCDCFALMARLSYMHLHARAEKFAKASDGISCLPVGGTLSDVPQ